MDVRFDGKVALVTGAGKGIGRAIAKQLLKCGAQTYALSRTQSDLDSLKEECPSIRTVCVDVSQWEATRKAVEDVGPVDLLVNNAGVAFPAVFLDVTEENIDKTFDIDLKAVFNISQVVAKSLIARSQGGAILNISSMLSKMAYQNFSVYGAAKAALDQLTRVMALELGPHQIRVNSVNPGIVKTHAIIEGMKTGLLDSFCSEMKNRSPQKRILELQDVVQPVLYLLSDKADMINGVNLSVDGGLTIC